MKTKNKSRQEIQKLVLLSVLSAIVAVLAYVSQFIALGGTPVTLTLIPVVLGAALCGQFAGAWLGGVSGVIILVTGQATWFLGFSIPGTIITVMVKGILSGFCAGLVYKILAIFNRYLAVLVSAIVCPVVNTGIFLLGSLIFFMDTVSAGAAADGMSVGGYLIVAFVGLNFVFELLANIIFSPVILKVLSLRKKHN